MIKFSVLKLLVGLAASTYIGAVPWGRKVKANIDLPLKLHEFRYCNVVF